MNNECGCTICRYVYDVMELCPKHRQEEWKAAVKEATSGWPVWSYVADGDTSPLQIVTCGS